MSSLRQATVRLPSASQLAVLQQFTYIGADARAKWTRVGAFGRDGEIADGDPLGAERCAANEASRSRQHVVTNSQPISYGALI